MMNSYDEQMMSIFDKALEETTSKPKESVPYQILTFDEKERWYFDPVKKTMVRVCNNTEIVQISVPDEYNKVVVRGPGCFLYVPFEDVEDIGFN